MPTWMKEYAESEEEFHRECWWYRSIERLIYERYPTGWRFQSALAREKNWEVVVVTLYDILDRAHTKVICCKYNNGDPIISEPSDRR